MSDAPIRFGLIGYGLFGRHHANAIANAPGAALTAIAVRSADSQAAARSDHPNTDVTGDYHALVERDDVDVIDIVSPNDLHYEMARAALEAGRHVLLEKPMALTTAHCDELIALAEANGRVLAVNHELRHSSLWGGVRRRIEAGVIGTPQYALIELSRFPYRQGSQGWRYDIDRVGNWILEEPIHFFDLARWCLADGGQPVSVYARANARQPQQPELKDNFTATVNFDNGAFAVICQTLAAFEHHVMCKITGTRGALWAWWSAADARSDKPTFGLRVFDGEVVEDVAFDAVTGELVELEQQIAAMVRCVRDGEKPACDGRDGRWSVRLCLAAQRSVDTGLPAAVADI